MKNVNVSVRVASVMIGLALLSGCSSEESKDGDNANASSSSSSGGASSSSSSSGSTSTVSLPAALETYQWADPAPAGTTKLNAKPVELTAKDKNQNESVFECTSYDNEATGSYDRIVWLSEESGPVKPGMVLQGKAFKEGKLLPVPVKRTPIKISVNLAIPNASATVDSPDTASIQSAISQFQQQADLLPDLPGNIERSVEEITKSEQVSLSLGVHASYSGVLASASLDTNLSHEMGLTQHTVVARLIQPMYTVSFADETLPTAASFFDPTLSEADWKAQQESGTISEENPPVFISSVTYGRLVMVSLSSTQGETRDELKVLIEGSTVAYSGSVDIEAKRAQQWSTLRHQEYQRGGSANSAADAMTSGDFRKFFSKALPSTMVPIAFTVKTLSGNRKVARIGDLTKYTAPECQTTGAWKPVTQIAQGNFTSVGVGNGDVVWATNSAQPTKLFQFDKATAQFNSVDVPYIPLRETKIRRVSVGRDGTVGAHMEDNSLNIRYADTGTFRRVEEGAIQYDANDGNREVNTIDVFDATHIAVTNHEDITWTTDGFTTGAKFKDWSSTGLIGMDQFNHVWHAYTGGGIQFIDLESNNARNVGNLTKPVDSLAVGAPNDVWITYDGANYQYDPRSESDTNVPAWKLRNMGQVMPIIDVGVDGHLWGISADGRVQRWLGLRPQ